MRLTSGTCPAGALIALALALLGGGRAFAYELHAVNVTDRPLADHPVVVPLERLPEEYRVADLKVVAADTGREQPSQVDDLRRDGTPDELVFLADFEPGRRRTFRLSRAPAGSFPTDLQVPDNFSIFRNSFLSCEAITGELLGLRVKERASGEFYLTDLHLSGDLHGIGRARRRTYVVARGPARIVVEQSFLSSERRPTWRVIQRYTMYGGEAGFDFEIEFENLTGATRRLELYNDSQITKLWWRIVRGMEGPLLSRDLQKMHSLGVRFYRTSRLNFIKINPSTGRSMGVACHSPRWRYISHVFWAPPGMRADGVWGPLNRPDDPYVFLGRVGSPPPDSDSMNFRKGIKNLIRAIEVPPAGRRTLGLSFRFYRGLDKEQALERFGRDVEAAMGLVNVHGAGGRTLAVAGEPLYLKEEFEDADRWLPTGGAKLSAGDGALRISVRDGDGGAATALSRDWSDPTELRGRLESLTEGARLEIAFRSLSSGRSYPLLTLEEAGEFRVLVTDYLPNDLCSGIAEGTLELRLRGAGGGGETVLERMALSWPLPGTPVLNSPAEGARVQQFSTTISPRTPEVCERAYRVQVARDEDFNRLAADITRANHIRIPKSHIRYWDQTVAPDEKLGPGTYWLRGRAIGILGERSPWSEPRSFTVVRAAPPAEGPDLGTGDAPPPARRLSPRDPLFVMFDRPNDRFLDSLPEQIRRSTAFQPSLSRIEEQKERYFAYDRTPFFGASIHTATGIPNFSFLGELFRRNPHAMGFWYNEDWPPPEMAGDILRFAADHDRYMGVLSRFRQAGSIPSFYQAMGEVGEHAAFVFKSQNPHSPLDKQLNLIGLWLSGRIGHWGVETEWWTPHATGKFAGYYAPEGKRAVDWMPVYIMGLAYGAELYCEAGGMSGRPPGTDKLRVWRTDQNRLGELWNRAMGPFVRDLLAEDLVPTRRQVRHRVRVALQLEEGQAGENYPFHLVDGVNGVPTHWLQWLPDNPRYGIVPVLPALAAKRDRSHFEKVFRTGEFETARQAMDAINRYYPPIPSRAFCVRSGDTGVITNNRDLYRDVPLVTEKYIRYFGKVPTTLKFEDYPLRATPQYYHMELDKGPVSYVEGRAEYRQYVILKQRPGSLFVHANNYRERKTRLVLGAPGKVSVEVLPRQALGRRRVLEGDEGRRVELVLTHDHPEGSVRVYVRESE